ncbi:MAG: hypothetical protein M9892_04535 [Bacteroidetes bacterium]|nr:hypothetical protein [Bacteroidota bacterium]
MDNWQKLYLELAELLCENKQIEWIDLWHNQVGFMEEEHPFPAPAIFLGFRSMGMEDLGSRMQKVNVQVDTYLFYETFADTYKGGINQADALEFLTLMDWIQATLHGTTGKCYSGMRRTDFAPVDTGSAGNLYRISFVCDIIDEFATPPFEEREEDIDVEVQPYDLGQ